MSEDNIIEHPSTLRLELPLLIIDEIKTGKYSTLVFNTTVERTPGELGIVLADSARVISAAIAERYPEFSMGEALAEVVRVFNAEISKPTAIINGFRVGEPS